MQLLEHRGKEMANQIRNRSQEMILRSQNKSTKLEKFLKKFFEEK